MDEYDREIARFNRIRDKAAEDQCIVWSCQEPRSTRKRGSKTVSALHCKAHRRLFEYML